MTWEGVVNSPQARPKGRGRSAGQWQDQGSLWRFVQLLHVHVPITYVSMSVEQAQSREKTWLLLKNEGFYSKGRITSGYSSYCGGHNNLKNAYS